MKTKIKPRLALFLLPVLASIASAASQYDFYICANINRNYVVGSKITTTNGVYHRADDGSWVHTGYNDTSITAVAFDPRDRNVSYTSGINGLWRTLDGGKHWRMVNSWDITEGRDVAVDPNAPDHVYLAIVDGVAVSTDRGQTIERREKGLPERGKYTQTIEVDRTKAGRVLAGCEAGIFLTDNGAKSWRRVLATKATVNDVQQSPQDPKLWFAVTQSDGAWTSRDGGVKWEKVAGVPSDHALYNMTFDSTNPQRLAIGSWGHGVLASEDGGKTWVKRNDGLPGQKQVWRVGVDPDAGRLYASVVGETLMVSNDFGRTWKPDALEGSLVNSFLILPKAAK